MLHSLIDPHHTYLKEEFLIHTSHAVRSAVTSRLKEAAQMMVKNAKEGSFKSAKEAPSTIYSILIEIGLENINLIYFAHILENEMKYYWFPC